MIEFDDNPISNEVKDDVSLVRYGTPNGNIWVAENTDAYGIGCTREDAKLELKENKKRDLLEVVASSVVGWYQQRGKSPMLIVDTNNWTHKNSPFYLVQLYDIHFRFYPNTHTAWVIEAIAIGRKDKTLIRSMSADLNINEALKRALWGLIPHSIGSKHQIEPNKGHSWFVKGLYSTPKISLKDVLNLETYTELPKFEELTKVVADDKFIRVIKGGKL